MNDRIHYHQLSESERREVLDRLKGGLNDIENVRFVYAYGSFVRGEAFRDLDLAVLLADANDWRAVGRVEGAVKRAFAESPVPFDVVPLNDATPGFRHEVVTTGVLLFEKERGESKEFYVRCVSEHLDFEAFRRTHGGS